MARRPRESEHIRHIPHLKVFAEPDVMKHYETALSSGYEGIVWKSLDHRYENKRNFDWMRMVPVKSEDCEVLGVYEGKGKMAGIAGGIYIDFKGIRCKCGTMKGMTYEDREELLANADNYVGQCLAEVEYKELQPSGKPRQPRFKRWRWDK
jgi:ATP-dependent DNA ligase